ncbi:hypothetical protein EDD53_2380 [Pacificibacter maritimus]|uniref:Flagellar export protein FliJ n=1 Tax=Pacificibacter maritimus TaxID=762213 RepID=A0A3N4UBU0_9RHOB|nr:hypothetical protein [Pacificibacter maritimus]RPE64621.1 hypothetical protein EDD53_2380 [Pacificibacter maritimus]
MSDLAKKVMQLQHLAELKLNMELSHLQAITAQRDAPLQVIEAINAEKKAIQTAALDDNDFTHATLSGVDQNWAKWAQVQQKTAMENMARIAQKRESQLQIARQAFGRVDALKALANKE